MFEAVLEGLMMLFQWPTFGYMLIGVMCGLIIGVIPGLGGGIGIILLLPFTFSMDSSSAFALLLGMYAVTCTSDTIVSIMLGVPGTAASQATILDGYPLAKKGQASRALGAAFTVSAFGGIFGATMLALSLPLIQPVIHSFMNPELFMLGFLGISMVGALGGKSPWRGLATGALGILIATIGYSESGAVPRYTFDMTYLLDGAPLLPIVLGLFAVPELLGLAVKSQTIASGEARTGTDWRQMFQGVADAIRNKWLALRCAFMGTYIGILPGLGGSIVDWVAYGHAVQSTKKDPKFGEGDIRGVIAPEAANNAMRGGGLIPTVTFGIPGTTGYAILLGALLVKGLQPGPEMLTTQLPLTMSLVWTLIIANLLAACLMFGLSGHIAKLAWVPGRLLVPGVMIFVFMGAFSASASIGDWLLLIFASIIGYLMKKGGWPRPPIILGLILGGLMENSFLISVQAYENWSWVQRPVVMAIMAIIAITIVLSIVAHRRRKAQDLKEGKEPPKEETIFTLIIGGVLVAAFGAAFMSSLDWTIDVRFFPLVATIAGLFFGGFAFLQTVMEIRQKKDILSIATEDWTEYRGAVFYLLALCATIVGSMIFGQKIALTVFVLAFLLRWGGYAMKQSLIYTAVCWAILVLFYDRLLDTFWMDSVIGDFVSELPHSSAWKFLFF